MVAADDRMIIGARRFQGREMILGMDFETVVPGGEIPRGMERQRKGIVTVAPALDQPTTFVWVSVPRMALDPRPEFARQRQLHFSAAALT
jgi:hypothetical protein